MGSVYHEAAQAFLASLGEAKPDKDAFIAVFNDQYLGWQGDVAGLKGYLTSHHHESLIVARALHDALPVPFNTVPYKPNEQHGMATVMAYAATASAKDLGELIARSEVECLKAAS